MKIAFVFPGQGSQTIGMLDAWSDNNVVKNTMDIASNALDQDLTSLIQNGPASDLNLTTNTQPVMLAASIAMYNAYIDAGGVVPEIMAGHSLGEYTALTAAGVFDVKDAVGLVRVRANAMQDAVPVGQGAMAAILGLSDEDVRSVCEAAAQNEIVQAVNFNAPAQVVIAGNTDAVNRACELAKEKGAKRALPLPVSAPFHSSLLQPAAQVLSQALDKIIMNSPKVKVVNNVDVVINNDTNSIKDALTRQAWHAVRWVETIQSFKQHGITHVVECGPGKVLSGLTKRIDRDLISISINSPESLQQALETIQG